LYESLLRTFSLRTGLVYLAVVFHEEICFRAIKIAVFSGLVLFHQSSIQFKNDENHKSFHAGILLGQVKRVIGTRPTCRD